MAETAFQIQYRQEFIAGFEQLQSLLRSSTTTESVIKGNQATFLVADSGNATAKTRGVNGLIPARGDNLSQPVATLVEWHDLVRKTDFNIFASQGNQRAIMQKTTMGVINRKIDQDIIAELATGTQNLGVAATADTLRTLRAKTILGNNEVPWDGWITALVTPGYEAYMMGENDFASRDYTMNGPFDAADPAWKDQPVTYRWLGMNWIVHPRLPGQGTAAETCFFFHKSAIGHAYNADDMEMRVGYDEEQDYSWARCSIYMGSQVLQNSGIVLSAHDSSALAAA
ncbi:MAG: hypothetical protein AMJ84_00145 [Acidithiobacillales bacterium SM23_46]|nr:MAG: hypothetical protein AMJ84_00145 [Acidithiobacillales bacterium SM23_46]KPL29034.1 MAG: hypothetical protein AMJ72_00305 [Acidithiobacillales bacterium SM1_46]